MECRFCEMSNRLALAAKQLDVFLARHIDRGDEAQAAIIAEIEQTIVDAGKFFADINEEEDYDDE